MDWQGAGVVKWILFESRKTLENKDENYYTNICSDNDHDDINLMIIMIILGKVLKLKLLQVFFL